MENTSTHQPYNTFATYERPNSVTFSLPTQKNNASPLEARLKTSGPLPDIRAARAATGHQHLQHNIEETKASNENNKRKTSSSDIDDDLWSWERSDAKRLKTEPTKFDPVTEKFLDELQYLPCSDNLTSQANNNDHQAQSNRALPPQTSNATQLTLPPATPTTPTRPTRPTKIVAAVQLEWVNIAPSFSIDDCSPLAFLGAVKHEAAYKTTGNQANPSFHIRITFGSHLNSKALGAALGLMYLFILNPFGSVTKLSTTITNKTFTILNNRHFIYFTKEAVHAIRGAVLLFHFQEIIKHQPKTSLLTDKTDFLHHLETHHASALGKLSPDRVVQIKYKTLESLGLTKRAADVFKHTLKVKTIFSEGDLRREIHLTEESREIITQALEALLSNQASRNP